MNNNKELPLIDIDGITMDERNSKFLSENDTEGVTGGKKGLPGIIWEIIEDLLDDDDGGGGGGGGGNGCGCGCGC